MRADHALVVLSHKGPDWHEPGRLLVLEHRLDETILLVGRNERGKWMIGAEGIPEGERGVVDAAWRDMDFAVRAPVASVDVGDVVRLDEEAVHRGVEACILFVRAFDFHARKLTLPRGGRGGTHCVEVERGDFRSKVFLGSVRAHEGIADLGHERCTVGKVEAKREARPLLVGRKRLKPFA